MLVFTVFLALLIDEMAANKLTKCLERPESSQKNYVRYENKLLNLTIQTSQRPAHQVTSHILKIILDEAMNYANVDVIIVNKTYSLENVTSMLSVMDQDESTTSEPVPEAMVDLEVWVPPEVDTVSMLRPTKVSDCGQLRSPIKYGWHIPKQLIDPITNFDKKWTARAGVVPWTFFLDANFSSFFNIEDEQMKPPIQDNTDNTSSNGCSNEACGPTPDVCKTNKCATILMPINEIYCNEYYTLIDSGIFAKLVYLGGHIKKTIHDITTDYTNKSIGKSIIVSAWAPSELVPSSKDYVKIAFEDDAAPLGCPHELMRIEKFAWSNLEKLAPSAYKTILNMQFTDDEFQDLLNISSEFSYEDMACAWLKNHSSWKSWYTQETIKKIYIVGIFPIKLTNYNGSSIINIAKRAVRKINSNQAILNGYTLELVYNDGMCNAEKVMRIFIDYVSDSDYHSILGVLGPACSDTVEPLAGIAKHFRTLMISYGAEGASFSNREKYPYFFRTIASNNVFKFVYLELMKKFGWRRLATLTEDGQKYTEYILHTQSLLEAHGISFVLNVKFSRDQKNITMRKYLEDIKSRGARIIIADVFDSVARSVMCYAREMNMTMRHGYVWFLPTWLDDSWYDTTRYNIKAKENVSCTTEIMRDAINGYFSLSPSFWGSPDSKTQENITVSEWRSQNDTKGISNYAGFAYDAVWAYALALDSVLKTNPEAISDLHSKNTTKLLVKAIEDLDFNGVSGRINFRGGSSRYSTINLKQWTRANNKTQVGYFQPDFGNTSQIIGGDLILNETAIAWLAGSIPDDGSVTTARCSLETFARSLNIGCEAAIVLVCFMVFSSVLSALALWIFSYKFKVDTRIFKTRRIIKSLGLDYTGDQIFELDKFAISRDNVVINRKLGEGSFGTVYGGEALIPGKGWVAVAVKTLRSGSTIEDKVDFLSEADTMSRFNHKNIIKLIGVTIHSNPVYTVVEFMLYGDLKTYLLARRSLTGEDVSSKRLTMMALDVAKALCYLAEIKYVHRDVSCKNCLVNSEMTVKLSKFEMTNAKKNLPVRWMSPESLALGVFTISSDVWSYGILLYEIMTFGNIPYQGMSNNQVLEYVKKGHTLDIPRGVKPQLEALMRTCWAEDYKKRPKASDLVAHLESNPELVCPCIDGPLAPIVMDDADDIVHFPRKLRSTSRVLFRNPSFSNEESLTGSPLALQMDSKTGNKNCYSATFPFKFKDLQPYKSLTDDTEW